MNTALLTPKAMQESTPTLLPITERLLAKLPGPRWRWQLVWSLVPVMQLLTLTAISFWSRFGLKGMSWDILAMGLAPTLVWGYAIWMSLWGVAKFARDVTAIEGNLSTLIGKHNYAAKFAFRGMESSVGPLILAIAITLIFGTQLILYGWWVLALLNIPFALLIHFPVTTWFWNYLMLMLGLNRLGKQHLTLESYAGDKSMGLRPVGSLAFSGFRMFAAILGPIVLVSMTDVLGLTVGLLFFVIGVIAFFLSLYRIHGQMAIARKGEIAKAHELYAKAYEPLRATPSLELLGKQAPLLSAAEALEKRLEGIQTWPFSDAIFARIVVVASGVVTAIIVKLLLKPLGM
jgi:hypothetical protein